MGDAGQLFVLRQCRFVCDLKVATPPDSDQTCILEKPSGKVGQSRELRQDNQASQLVCCKARVNKACAEKSAPETMMHKAVQVLGDVVVGIEVVSDCR